MIPTDWKDQTAWGQKDAELEKSENLKCEGGVKTSPTQSAKYVWWGGPKVKKRLLSNIIC